MKAVFADTFYWAALTSIDDPSHARAIDLSRSLVPDRIVTTDEVLSEYLTFFAGKRFGAQRHTKVGKTITIGSSSCYGITTPSVFRAEKHWAWFNSSTVARRPRHLPSAD